MKKFLVLFILINFLGTVQPMHVATNIATTLSMHCYDYLKNCNFGKIGQTLLIATVGVLVLDRILFRPKPYVIAPYATYSQTEIDGRIKSGIEKGVTEGFSKFLEETFSPKINELNEKIDNALQSLSKEKKEEIEKEKEVDIPTVKLEDSSSPLKIKKYNLLKEIKEISKVLTSLTQAPCKQQLNKSADTYYVLLNNELEKLFNLLISKIEVNLLHQLNKKFGKLKRKIPLYSHITTTRSLSEDEQEAKEAFEEDPDQYFGNLENNAFRDSNLVDSNLLETRADSSRRNLESSQHTPRSDDNELDIIFEE